MKNILDILLESESRLNSYKKFSPITGFGGKSLILENDFLRPYFAKTVILNQLRAHNPINGLSRKQADWLNLHHVTEQRL